MSYLTALVTFAILRCMTIGRGAAIRRRRLVALAAFLVLAVALLGWLWPHIYQVTDIDELRTAIESTGIWAPLTFMAINMMQVIIAPVPGSVVTMLGGVMFGVAEGIVLSMTASTIGFLAVFWMAKRYGRRLWRFFVSPRHDKRYERIVQSPRVLTFVTLTFLLPVIPDPIAAYVAGLTPVRMSKLLLICVLARLPGVAMTVTVGSYTTEQNYWVAGGLLLLLALALGLIYIYRARVDRLVERLYS